MPLSEADYAYLRSAAGDSVDCADLAARYQHLDSAAAVSARSSASPRRTSSPIP